MDIVIDVTPASPSLLAVPRASSSTSSTSHRSPSNSLQHIEEKEVEKDEGKTDNNPCSSCTTKETELDQLRVEITVLKQQLFDLKRTEDEWATRENLYRGKLQSKINSVSVLRETLYRDLTGLQLQLDSQQHHETQYTTSNALVDPDFTYLDAFRLVEANQDEALQEESAVQKRLNIMKKDYDIEQKKLMDRHDRDMLAKLTTIKALETKLEGAQAAFEEENNRLVSEMREQRVQASVRHEEAISQLREEFEQTERELRERNAKLEEELADVRLSYAEAEAELESTRRELEKSNNKMALMEETFEQRHQEMRRKHLHDVETAKKEYDAISTERNALTSQLRRLKTEYSDAQDKLENVRMEHRVMKSEHELAVAEASKLRARDKVLSDALDSAKADQDKLKEVSVQLDEMEEKWRKDRWHLNASQQKVKSLEGDLVAKQNELDELATDYTAVSTQLENSKKTLQKLYNGVLGKEKEDEYEMMKRRMPKMESRMRSVRLVLEAIGNHTGEMLRTAKTLHDVPRNYSDAIASLRGTVMTLQKLQQLEIEQIADGQAQSDGTQSSVHWKDIDAEYGAPTTGERDVITEQVDKILLDDTVLKKKLMREVPLLRIDPRRGVLNMDSGDPVERETQCPTPRTAQKEADDQLELERLQKEDAERQIVLHSRAAVVVRPIAMQTTPKDFQRDKWVGQTPRGFNLVSTGVNTDTLPQLSSLAMAWADMPSVNTTTNARKGSSALRPQGPLNGVLMRNSSAPFGDLAQTAASTRRRESAATSIPGAGSSDRRSSASNTTVPMAVTPPSPRIRFSSSGAASPSSTDIERSPSYNANDTTIPAATTFTVDPRPSHGNRKPSLVLPLQPDDSGDAHSPRSQTTANSSTTDVPLAHPDVSVGSAQLSPVPHLREPVASLMDSTNPSSFSHDSPRTGRTTNSNSRRPSSAAPRPTSSRYSRASGRREVDVDVDEEYTRPIRRFVTTLWSQANDIAEEAKRRPAQSTLMPFSTLDELGQPSMKTSWDMLEAEVYALLEHISVLRSGGDGGASMLKDDGEGELGNVQVKVLHQSMPAISRDLSPRSHRIPAPKQLDKEVELPASASRPPSSKGKRCTTFPAQVRNECQGGAGGRSDAVDTSTLRVGNVSPKREVETGRPTSGLSHARPMSAPAPVSNVSATAKTRPGGVQADGSQSISLEMWSGISRQSAPSKNSAKSYTRGSRAVDGLTNAPIHDSGVRGCVSKVVRLGGGTRLASVIIPSTAPSSEGNTPPARGSRPASATSVRKNNTVSRVNSMVSQRRGSRATPLPDVDDSTLQYTRVPDDIFTDPLKRIRERRKDGAVLESGGDSRVFFLETKKELMRSLKDQALYQETTTHYGRESSATRAARALNTLPSALDLKKEDEAEKLAGAMVSQHLRSEGGNRGSMLLRARSRDTQDDLTGLEAEDYYEKEEDEVRDAILRGSPLI
eukprot:PhM_4_TR12607/c0_g1_i1/m.86962